MASDAAGRSPIEYIFFGVIDFICLLMAAESFNIKQYDKAGYWAIAGVASLLIGYYWPKIKLNLFRKKPAFTLGMPVIIDTTTNIAGLNRRFVQIPCSTRIRIANCRGQLLHVWKWLDNNWQPTQVDEPIDLNWSILDTPNVSLEPTVARRLNVFFLQNDNRLINFASDRVPFRMALSSAPSNIYKFDVRISADESPSNQIIFKATFGQNWDDIKVEELPNGQ